MSITDTLLGNSKIGPHQFANSQAGRVVFCAVYAQA
jgi:hypothetical protein